jgi:hypothetical protein
VTRYAETTQVSSDRSRAEIERILTRYGASAFAYGWEKGSSSVMFEMASRRIVLRLPLPDEAEFTLTPTGKKRSAAQVKQTYEQAVRQRWRALALVIKAKLEAIEAGISTVEDEFLAHLALPGGGTVGEWLAPQLDTAYAQQKMPSLLPGGAQ